MVVFSENRVNGSLNPLHLSAKQTPSSDGSTKQISLVLQISGFCPNNRCVKIFSLHHVYLSATTSTERQHMIGCRLKNCLKRVSIYLHYSSAGHLMRRQLHYPRHEIWRARISPLHANDPLDLTFESKRNAKVRCSPPSSPPLELRSTARS